ncbi:M24 family metallopeptidase [Nonomuraea zeae]|uniref:Aminopeptidase P family protein n=1 Tax=Nonomuraea zeae TaxID=1642303 RepID=A0A5S4GTZ4_9ACTN|nr:M24 family metallopeptidase [Nonomuraea zeae]TMR35944.1 aminopeptidase P family protein [Nonomuraea zeae]
MRETAGDAPRSPASGELLLEPEGYAPADGFRLPLEWSKGRAAALLSAVDPDRRTDVLLVDPWNIVYYTGLWALTTERLLAVVLPADGGPPVWFYPYLDHELVTTWWYGDGESYFDVPDSPHGSPRAGVAVAAPGVPPWQWLVDHLARRGHLGRLATDTALPESALRVHGVAQPAHVGTVCLRQRMSKTPEELALATRAYRYFDEVHAWARDRLLQREPGLTDSRLRLEMTGWITDRIMADHGPGRAPHTTVGINVDLGWVRAGAVTGYPHPNQARYAVIQDSRTIQISGIIQIGGCGGELYRPYLLRPPTPFEAELWTVTRDTCLLLKDALRAGRTGGEVAQDVHRFQIAAGVQEYVATRPSHGQGMEGHQPPYISLGETTVLEPGMCFSVEPGLYDPAGGFGVNFSDTFVVQPDGPARQLSRLPWSEDWCWLGQP